MRNLQCLTRPILGTAMAAALLLPWLAAAADPAIQVQHPWARATTAHATTGAIYLALVSPQDDRLTGVSSPASRAAQLHETTTTAAGVSQMRPLDGLALPAGRTVSLAPGQSHVMLTGLSGPLVAGRSLTLHLSFAHAAPMDVTVPIIAAGAAGPDMPPMKM